MLVRDTPDDLEVYMVKRPGRGDFPDLHVFPGGKVDESDFAPHLCRGLDDVEASRRLGIEAGGLRYWMAVARECFEEAGVLLLTDHEGNFPGADKLATWREFILSHEDGFTQLCADENLQVDCQSLAYFSHWLTPEMAPRRFDTRFFLAAMPDDQVALAHVGETVGEQWTTPTAALDNFKRGVWQMIDPTLRSLETLSQYHSVDQAIAGARGGEHLMPLTDELRRQGMQPLR